MGDLSNLKVAIGQPELVDGAPSRTVEAQDRFFEMAVEAGADVLVMPGSLTDASDIRLVALNDSRVDVEGSTVVLEASDERFRIGLGTRPRSCDFAVYSDVSPWAVKGCRPLEAPGIVLRPVGIRNEGHKVLCFCGGSAVRAADGALLARLNDDFEEGFAVVSLVNEGDVAQPCKDKLLTALVKSIRRFDEQVMNGRPPWIIGLSGGLDSSVVAALLVLALGQERVLGYNLATSFNSQTTKDNASALAEALGLKLRSGSISDLVAATEATALQYGYGKDGEPALSGQVLENVQARVRGHMLSTFAALEGGVVANNGNRVECAFGYATLYGDAIGAFAPIGDLAKTDLFSLAKAINGQPGVGVIPERLLPVETDDGYEWDVMPSAELAEGQFDPMKWFYHDWLVGELMDAASLDAGACHVLERYLDDRLASSEVAKWVRYYGLEDPKAFIEDFDWVMRSIRASAFKRIQSPPVLKVASRASIDAGPESQGDREPSEAYKKLHSRIANR